MKFDDLVVANRILANENVVDAYGHVSMRHPEDPKRYALGGEVKALSRGELEARNAGYKPYSPETWRAWEYWATRAGCAHLLSRKQ